MIRFKHMFKSVMMLTAVITLFSCEGNYNNIQKMNLKDEEPVAVGKTINLKYTDSGKVTVNLLAPLLKDYSNFEFPYQEFPEGITLYFWDKENKVINFDLEDEILSGCVITHQGNIVNESIK